MNQDYQESSLHQQAESAVYLIQDHEKNENQNLNLNPNTLNFNLFKVDDKLLQQLYRNGSGFKGLSIEFVENLKLFYIYLTGLIFVEIGGWINLYNNNEIDIDRLCFVTLLSALILAFAYSILFMIIMNKRLYKHIRGMYTILCILLITYWLFNEEHNWSAIFQKEVSKSQHYSILMIVTLIIQSQLVLFHSFKHQALLTCYTLLVFLMFSYGISEQSSTISIMNFLGLLIFLVTQIIICYKTDFRIRQLFWRTKNEQENSNEFLKHRDLSDKSINTELENVINLMDAIKQVIYQAGQIIMFRDIKQSLKQATKDLDVIKLKVARKNFCLDVNINEGADVDDEDRVFLSQMFMNVNGRRDRKLSTLKGSLSLLDLNKDLGPQILKEYTSEDLWALLNTCGKNWNFDIWFVYDTTGQSISIIGKFLIEKLGLKDVFKMQQRVIERFFTTLESSYKNNPYHNACHAADVTHSLLYFIQHSEIQKYLHPIETIASLLASLAHDVGHPGLTNRFLVNNRDPLALKYNDDSVLENMHIAKLYKILETPGCQILGSILDEDWVQIRKVIIDMVLATDMTKHFQLLGNFRTRAVVLGDMDMEECTDRQSILVMGLKCADLGHSAKSTQLHEKWTEMVCNEFFNQGDLEKHRNLPVSMYCDRDTTDIPKSQAGFLRNVCLKMFDTWCDFLNSKDVKESCYEQILVNLAHWDSKSRKKRATAPLQDFQAIDNYLKRSKVSSEINYKRSSLKV